MMRCAAWLLAVLAVVSASSAAPAQVPPAAAAKSPPAASLYAQPPYLRGALLSPDGTRIAAQLSDGEVERIGIWTLAKGPDQEPHTISVGGLTGFRWAGNQRLLVTSISLSIIASSNAIYIGPNRRVSSHDLAGGKSFFLGSSKGAFDEVIFTDPDGGFVLLSSQNNIERSPSVRRVDLATEASVLVQPAVKGVWSWHADSRGVVRVGVDYDERRPRIHYRDNAAAPLRRYVPRLKLTDNSVIDEVRFVTETGPGLIVMNGENGRFGLYEYDFAADVRGAALFQHDEVDVDSMVIGPGGALEGVRYDDDKPRTRWFDPALAQLQAEIDKTFAGRTNDIVNRSRDGNRVLIFSSGANDAGTYYVFDRKARRMETFASPYDRLHDLPHADVRPIRYRSRDGLDIRGYLTLPPGRGERGLPLIVLPHGGPFLRDKWVFDPEVQFLASRGYAVLQANFRGSTGYGRAFVEKGFGQLGGGMINDLEDGVDWLAGQGIADPKRVCVMGSSYGGYAAMWAAIRSPARYRCAISWAGPTDLRAMLRHTERGFAARRYFRTFRQQIIGNPATELADISPAQHAARLRVPTLIAHGKRDFVVPVEQGERMIKALTAARVPGVEHVIYPKSGHDFGQADEREDYLKRVEAFLARHNPAAPQASPSGGLSNPAASR
jgi:dipeptidyl aminopeptidase/acylaminoacyl peptidase